MSYNFDDQPKGSRKLSITATLGARIVTLLCLVVSLVILKTDDVKNTDVTYKSLYSYRYGLYTMAISFVYTVLQVPFAIYYAKTGKRMINHDYIFEFDFYADKVNSLLLATTAGALFGSTIDVKDRSPALYHEFFNMIYIAAGFLLIGVIFAAVSSVRSSYALSRRG